MDATELCYMPATEMREAYRAKTLSPGGRGGRCITPRSSGSAARASPGRPSVTRLIQRMWIGSSGMGRPRNGARKIVQISPELLVIVYLAEKFYLRLRVFPVSQLAFTVLVLLGLYEFILFWIDGMAGRSVPLVERWVPPLTGTLVWILLYVLFDRREREAPARL